MDRADAIKLSITATFASISAALGWFGWLVVLYTLSMTIDWITGSAAAARAGEWSSKKARDGIWHKFGSVIVVIVAMGADTMIGSIINNIPGITLPFTYEVMLGPVVMVWYVVAEFGSIVENAAKLGANVPPFLRKAISALYDAADIAGEHMTAKEDKKEQE